MDMKSKVHTLHVIILSLINTLNGKSHKQVSYYNTICNIISVDI